MGEKKNILEKLGLIEKVPVIGNKGNTGNTNDAENKGNTAKTTNTTNTVNAANTANTANTVNNQNIVNKMVTQDKKQNEKKNENEKNAESKLLKKDPITASEDMRLLNVDEIYKDQNIKNQGIHSICIVEKYIQSLPEYLPQNVKKQTILNIITSSNVLIDDLVKNGKDKLECLKKFSDTFIQDATNIIVNCENEIKKLKEKIDAYNKAIDKVKNLSEEQKAIIQFERDKINYILKFINSNQ